MDILWSTIEEFPNYEVSNYGDVRRALSTRHLSRRSITGGANVVSLFQEGVQHTRSIKVLVADAFVPVIDYGFDADFDTPIQLDGTHDNCRADNLMWRPRWHALKYRRQFSSPGLMRLDHAVINITTSELFESVVDAATWEGVLIQDVFNAAGQGQGRRVFPTGHEYIFA